jgi:hypothetical protein
MQKESKIWSELKEISPMLSGINLPVNPYAVPEDYFGQFPETILSKIRMLEKESVSAEILELSELIGKAPKIEAYSAPQHYFENFAHELMKRIRAEEAVSAAEELEILSPVLGALDKKNPYSTPEEYFKELADNLSGGIQAVEFVNGELEKLPTVIDTLKRENPYQIPEGYFEKFPEKLLQKIRTQARPARVISLYNRIPGLKYAAAAVLTGILITIGIFTFTRHNNNAADPAAALAKASDQEIVNFMANQDILLSEKTSNSTALLELNENDVRDLFNEIPDAELQQYVNERSSGKDLITN